MDSWIVKDRIKRGVISFSVGDKVVLFRRKGKYPSRVKDELVYTIESIDGDFLFVLNPDYPNGFQGVNLSQSKIKVHKYYMVSKTDIRDLKIESVLR
jgi:hypothetical protein